MNITKWLEKLKNNWENKNIQNILSLFSKNVIYFETPFRRLKNFEEIMKEWNNIQEQKDIEFKHRIFSQSDNKYTIQWELKYTDNQHKQFYFKGVYLIKLNEKGLCKEFIQYCEEK